MGLEKPTAGGEQGPKEYLTIEEVSARLTLTAKTVRNKMAAGIFQRGVHYFSPSGIGPRFKWSAIVAWLECQQTATGVDEDEPEKIPMAHGYYMGNVPRKTSPLSS